MKTKSVISLFWDQRKADKAGLYTLYLRVTFRGERVYFALGKFTDAEYLTCQEGRARGKLKARYDACLSELARAVGIGEKLVPFDWARFKTQYAADPIEHTKPVTLHGMFGEYLAELESEGQAGVHRVYLNALNALKGYQENDMPIRDVSRKYCEGFIKHLQGRGLSASTVGMWARALRSICNRAINQGHLNREDYPFAGVRIPQGASNKRALELEEIRLLLNYQAETEGEQTALYLWIFGYFSNGMNLFDVCNLKYKQIEGDRFTFIRQKTKRLYKTEKHVEVKLNPISKGIIEKLGQKPVDPERHVFRYLEGIANGMDKKRIIDNLGGIINDHMKKICKKVGIGKKVTWYSGRHSFGTIMMHQGISLHIISELYGHSSIAMTENYLAKPKEDQIKEAYDKLL